MTLDLRARHIVVTGGTGALGSAVVGILLESGASIAIPVLHADELARFPFKGHASVRVIEGVDLADESRVSSFYESAAPKGLWASIHIAGGFAMAPLAQTPAADFRRMMDMNALTAFLCTREAVKRMVGPGGPPLRGGPSDPDRGRIVNIAARPGLSPELGADMVAYTASKAAVVAITRAAGAELAPRGVLVSAVAPSIMDTPANRKSMPTADHAAWPKVEEVARVIAFLASPENRVARGSVVEVYGRA